jgi:SWIM zinc finger
MASTTNSSLVGNVQANTILLKSFSGERWYSVSLDKRTCSCLHFITTLPPCKHLNALGIYGTPRPFVARTHPTFSQALSALVKSIRLEDSAKSTAFIDLPVRET